MSKTVNLNIPTDIAGWRQAVEQAKDIYWQARRDGATENEALFAVLDHCLADQFTDKG
jgi:hypothetical protein